MLLRQLQRLPGVAFVAEPAIAIDPLPRMDIAIFVGFAASGPLHTPVVIEDVAQFHSLFGYDAPLAWDAERGERSMAYLPSAVRAFFRQGGRRCWVVRVAHQPTTNHFALTGLSCWDGQELLPAVAVARSAGSWSDGMSVDPVVIAQPLGTIPVDQIAKSVDLPQYGPVTILVGDLLRFHFVTGSLAFAIIDRLEFIDQAQNLLRIHYQTLYWLDNTSPPSSIYEYPAIAITETPFIELLRLDLTVRQGTLPSWQLRDLGLTPAHPRFWGNLPDDTQFWQVPTDPDLHAFWQAVANPRFPLAGGSNLLTLPLPSNQPVPAPDPRSELERDGLAQFGADLFLDPDLATVGIANLLAEADFIRYKNPNPRTLIGIHAALAIEEAALISVPDAVHRGWQYRTPPAAPEPVPPVAPVPIEEWHFLRCDLHSVAVPNLEQPVLDQQGHIFLHWSHSAASVVVLQEALRPDWSDATTIYTGTSDQWVLYGRQRGTYYYRIQAQEALTDGLILQSAWSLGRTVVISPAGQWVLLPAHATSDQLADQLVASDAPLDQQVAVNPHLVAVQRTLIRMAAARGDLFALLALPEQARETAALQSVAALTDPKAAAITYTSYRADPPKHLIVAGFRAAEAHALSYVAVYHPWLIGREEHRPQELRNVPPDGAACGMLAARTIQRGAWIAPANQELLNVVGFTPAIRYNRRLDLLQSHINLLWREPHGVVALSALTLSDDPDLQPIGTRRLLSLLRRLALRYGNEYVFEPNSDTFRRQVERRYETILELLFQRGAFAGRTASQSFQLQVSDTPQRIDLGQLLVEIKVAPARPLVFLTVRLVQTGDRIQLQEGR